MSSTAKLLSSVFIAGLLLNLAAVRAGAETFIVNKLEDDNGPCTPDDCNNCGVDELDPEDLYSPTQTGHGVHVSGLASARASNGLGGAGSCWDCDLAVFKVESKGYPMLQSRVANALDALREKGVRIINMSFGRPMAEIGAANGR